MTMQNKSSPSSAKVNVEINLLGEFPKRINVGMRLKTEEVKEKWVAIKYDYVLKFCKTCNIQGDIKECLIINPKL